RGGNANATVQITGWRNNDQNQVINAGGTLSTACYSDFPVAQFRLQPLTITQFLPSGATAWFAASANDAQPLMGAQLNSGQFNGGGNARALSYAAEYRIKAPVSVVSCVQ